MHLRALWVAESCFYLLNMLYGMDMRCRENISVGRKHMVEVEGRMFKYVPGRWASWWIWSFSREVWWISIKINVRKRIKDMQKYFNRRILHLEWYVGWVPKHVTRSEYISSKIGASFQKNLEIPLYIVRTGYKYQRNNGIGVIFVTIQVSRDFSG